MTRPTCSDASTVSPGDSHLDQVLPQASRFISPLFSLTHIKPLAHPAAVKRNACRRRLCAAVRESESSMIRSGRAHQLWSRANVNNALPPHPMYAHARACGASKATSDAACAHALSANSPCSADILMVVGEASVLLGRPFTVRAARPPKHRPVRKRKARSPSCTGTSGRMPANYCRCNERMQPQPPALERTAYPPPCCRQRLPPSATAAVH